MPRHWLLSLTLVVCCCWRVAVGTMSFADELRVRKRAREGTERARGAGADKPLLGARGGTEPDRAIQTADSGGGSVRIGAMRTEMRCLERTGRERREAQRQRETKG